MQQHSVAVQTDRRQTNKAEKPKQDEWHLAGRVDDPLLAVAARAGALVRARDEQRQVLALHDRDTDRNRNMDAEA
jgi:hypothetical protein